MELNPKPMFKKKNLNPKLNIAFFIYIPLK